MKSVGIDFMVVVLSSLTYSVILYGVAGQDDSTSIPMIVIMKIIISYGRLSGSDHGVRCDLGN